MSSARKAIQSAVSALGLKEADFSPLSPVEERTVLGRLANHFVAESNCTWWWEFFSQPFKWRSFEDGMGYARLAEIVPDKSSPAWLMVEADSSPEFAVYSTSAASAQQVIGECYAFEYYLVAKDLSWLVCENHHDVVFALGDAQERLANVAG